MSIRTRVATAVTAAAAVAMIAGGIATAGAASASVSHPKPQPHPTITFTPPSGPAQHCSPLYADYTGHQTNLNGFALDTSMSFFGTGQVTGVRHPRDCGQFWFAPQGGSGKSAALLDSNGTPGADVIAEINHHIAVVPGNGSPSQEWTANQVNNGFEWANDATGDIITIGLNGQVSLTHNTTANHEDTFNFGA